MRLRTLTVAIATALSSLVVLAAPASAAGELCYDISVVVSGEAVVSEQDCQQIG